MKDKVVGILNYRWGSDRIKQLMDFIFHQSNSTLTELASYAKYPTQLPYFTESDNSGWLICGKSTNPYLVGKKVEDLTISKDNEGQENIIWTELPKYIIKDARPIPITQKKEIQYNRQLQGPIMNLKSNDDLTLR